MQLDAPFEERLRFIKLFEDSLRSRDSSALSGVWIGLRFETLQSSNVFSHSFLLTVSC